MISFLTVFHRMAGANGQPPPAPEAAWPDNTYSTPQKRLSFNDEPVVIMHQPANTDGNSIVLFRKSDVVSAGDLLDLTGVSAHRRRGGGKSAVDRGRPEPSHRDHRAPAQTPPAARWSSLATAALLTTPKSRTTAT